MKKKALFLIFLLGTLISQAQEIPTNLKGHIIIEDQYMYAYNNLRGPLFPLINNELSITYGLTNFIDAGIFHDYFNEQNTSGYWKNKFRKHLVGLKANLSLLSLLREVGLNNKTKRFDLFVSGYYTAFRHEDSKTAITSGYDKKERYRKSFYSRAGARYFIFPKLCLTTSVGIYNTDRLFIGLGYKF